MPWVSLHIDEETLKRIGIAAKTEGLSLSKYVSRKLRASLEDRWPDHFDELFGAIRDPSFRFHSDSAAHVPRETM